MRPVLAVLGIAIGAILLSILFQRPKELTSNPAERAEEKRVAEEKKVLAEYNKNNPKPKAGAFVAPKEGAVTAVLTVADRGDITMEFYPKAAPKTVARLVELIKSKFYDGILIHRVAPGFVVQAGDPTTKKYKPADLAKLGDDDLAKLGIGSNGSGTNIPFEKNDLTNVAGSIAMALNSPKSATGDSQWFINLVDNSFLNGDYCVFGKVTQGMDVVPKIKKGDQIKQFTIK